jgi:hypothetical protein
VLVAGFNTPTSTNHQYPSLLDLLTAQQLPPHFWAQYFHLPNAVEAPTRLAAAAASGDVAAIYDFLCSYLLLQGGQPQQQQPHRHWEEAALTNGLKLTLHPLSMALAAAHATTTEEEVAVVVEEEEEEEEEASPLLLLRGASASMAGAVDDAAVVAAAVGGFPLLLEEEEGEGEGDLEVQLGMLFDGPDVMTPEQQEQEQQQRTAVQQQQPPQQQRRGKELGRLLSLSLSASQQQQQQEQEQEQEQVVDSRGLRRSGRARRAAVTYAEDYDTLGSSSSSPSDASDNEEEDEEDEESSSASASAAAGAASVSASAGASVSVYPGRPEPAGKQLPDRGRHKCRMPGCVEEYRWPDYFCKVHGVSE